MKDNISEMVRASVKLRETTFVDIDICHRMAYLRKLYAMTLTNFLNVKNLKCLKCVELA